jgi:hypothetical protein
MLLVCALSSFVDHAMGPIHMHGPWPTGSARPHVELCGGNSVHAASTSLGYNGIFRKFSSISMTAIPLAAL